MACVLYFHLALLLVCFPVIAGKRQCLGDKNQAVDWYIVYKLPKIAESGDPLVQEGLGYVYMDAASPAWRRGSVSLNSTEQAIGFTLQQVYNNHQQPGVSNSSAAAMYAFYNDETPPKKVSYDHGHTKGVVAFDAETGFWLVHSLPRFPNWASNESYSYPHSGLTNGQTFLCMSLATDPYMEKIGELLTYNWPQIYDQNFPDGWEKGYPKMAAALNGDHVTDAPYNVTTMLTTLGNVRFQAFAKFAKFDADLYDHWIAPYYRDDLYVETWQNGRGALPSACNLTRRVYNVQNVSILGDGFRETKDHSKWAVAKEKHVACIGDINRAESQEGRCGGTVCLQHQQVAEAFRNSVTGFERCKGKPSGKNKAQNEIYKRGNKVPDIDILL